MARNSFLKRSYLPGLGIQREHLHPVTESLWPRLDPRHPVDKVS